MFGASSRPVIGVDVGSSCVKMVALRKNGDGWHVTAAAMSDIAESGDGVGPSQSAVVSAIEECLKSSNGRISRSCNFVFALSGPKVKVSSFNFPMLTLDEVANAVRFEAAQICPFDIRDCIVDYQVIGMEKGDTGYKKKKVFANVTGVLAIASKAEISHKRKLAADALLKCVLVDADGLALLNCLEGYLNEGEGLPAAVVDVGRSNTTVTILGDNGLPFIRELRCSGSDVLAHIAKCNGMSVERAEQALLSGENPEGVKAGCKRLIDDINETLVYYSIQRGSDQLKHVYVCGGFSLASDFVKVLGSGIEGHVSVWNPFSRMNCGDDPAGDLVGRCGPAFAVAAGLAMREV